MFSGLISGQTQSVIAWDYPIDGQQVKVLTIPICLEGQYTNFSKLSNHDGVFYLVPWFAPKISENQSLGVKWDIYPIYPSLNWHRLA